MVDKTAEGNRFNCWLLLYAAAATFVVFISIAAGTLAPDISLILYIFVVVPVISLSLLVAAFRKKRRQRLSILSMLAICWAISAALVGNYSAVRTTVRWLVWSHRYKAEVLAQPAPANGELKHSEWDGWGWAGMDTTVYLAFDPTDSLSAAAKSHSPGKFSGIPCKVFSIRRLENHWYSVQLYTNEFWGRCNEGGASER